MESTIYSHTKITQFFYSAKSYRRYFWWSAAVVILVDAFWLHAITRHHFLVQKAERIFLSHPYSPIEFCQQILIGFIIWTMLKEREAFQGNQIFRKLFLALLFLVFIEEVSWGQIFYRYAWPEPLSPMMGTHFDFHNLMVGGADISDLLEALAGTFTCFLLVPGLTQMKVRKFFGIPELPLTYWSFQMLSFSFLLSPFSMIREVNEQDLIYENAILASIIMGLLSFCGKLQSDDQKIPRRPSALWVLSLLPWIKFFYIMKYGHYELFDQWP